MYPVGFEPTVPASERLQTHALDGAVTGTGGLYVPCTLYPVPSVDKKNQLDVTFWILYFSSNCCSTCFRQPCAHHQELTTA